MLVIDEVEHAYAIAQALVESGLRVLEVTLRTPAALDVIAAMKAIPGAIVGAGTVLNEADLHAALEAGAKFIVSPGLTEPLARLRLPTGGRPAALSRTLQDALPSHRVFSGCGTL